MTSNASFRLSRSSSLSSLNSVDETFNDEDLLSKTIAEKPKNNKSFERKFIISKENLTSGGIYTLCHYRFSASALFHISDDNFDVSEILKFGEGKRSMFYGDSVVKDGTIIAFSPIHPLFLIISYLQKDANNCFFALKDLLENSEYPALRLLAKNKNLINSLKIAADYKENDDLIYYRYNEDKLLFWLEKRFDILLASIIKNGGLGKQLLADEESLRRYTFGIFCDFFPVYFDNLLKDRLKIMDAKHFVAPTNINLLKRVKNSDEINESAPVKKLSISTASKKLQQASKVVMNLALPRAMRKMTSRVFNKYKGIDNITDYGKHMMRLSSRIFTEPTRPVTVKSTMVLKVMSQEPWEQSEEKSVEYFPNLPMFHYLTKMLRLHGIFMDEHIVWRLIQDELLIMRGKVVRPPIGQGKRAQIRNAKK